LRICFINDRLISFTPDMTAEKLTKFDFVSCAIRRANVVLPEPVVPAISRWGMSARSANGGTPASSPRAYFRQVLVEGTHFSTLEDLAGQLETCLQKLSASSTVSFTASDDFAIARYALTGVEHDQIAGNELAHLDLLPRTIADDGRGGFE
jgi:hypothetical protein